MQLYHTTGIVDKLVKEGLVWDEDEAKAIASLTEYWKDSIAIVWNVNDITRIGERIKINLKEKEAHDILQKIYMNHDPEKGVTIFVIIKEIRDFKGKSL